MSDRVIEHHLEQINRTLPSGWSAAWEDADGDATYVLRDENERVWVTYDNLTMFKAMAEDVVKLHGMGMLA